MAKDVAVSGGGMTVARIAEMAQQGMEQGVSVEALEKLFGLLERAMERDQRSQFQAAMAAFQADCPPIAKSRVVTWFDKKAGVNRRAYSYAELHKIDEAIRPIAHKHGLSYRFDSHLDENVMTAFCHVTHVGGHTETSRFSCPIEGQAKMNKVQSAGSTRSYSKRYALIDAFGLSIAEDDDDGQAAGEQDDSDEPITVEQLADVNALLDEVFGPEPARENPRKKAFFDWLNSMGYEVLGDLPQSQLSVVVKALERRRT